MMDQPKSLTVTLVQTALHWEDKQANLEMLEKKISAVPKGSELVILPEMFSTGFTMEPAAFAETMEGDTVAWMKRIAQERRIVITGSIIVQEEDKYFNRLIWMLPTGDFAWYDKRHLFTFAGEHHNYYGGNRKLIASLNGWKINLQVCYDLRFPIWARQPMEVEKRYDLYINVANWPAARSHAWRSLLTARAIENQAFVIGVNRVGDDGNDHHYSGDSMIIGPLGEELYHRAEDEDMFTYTLQKRALEEVRSHFSFLDDADRYTILNE